MDKKSTRKPYDALTILQYKRYDTNGYQNAVLLLLLLLMMMPIGANDEHT